MQHPTDSANLQINLQLQIAIVIAANLFILLNLTLGEFPSPFRPLLPSLTSVTLEVGPLSFPLSP